MVFSIFLKYLMLGLLFQSKHVTFYSGLFFVLLFYEAHALQSLLVTVHMTDN